MKKIFMLAIVLLVLVAIVPNSEATGLFLLPSLGHVIASAGSSGAFVGLGYMGIMQGAVLTAFSPYFILYYKHPECRQEKSIGEMSECIQKGVKK